MQVTIRLRGEIIAIMLLMALPPVFAFADGHSPEAPPARQALSAQKQQAIADAVKGMAETTRKGPADISLLDQAVLTLPAGYVYVPPQSASAFMRSIGNKTAPEFNGLIFFGADKLRWFITIDYIKAGYVKDDDAKSWNADALLESMRKNTEAQNHARIAEGLGALEVVGWLQPPAYDTGNHRLVWAVLGQSKGAGDGVQIVNYNTFALGREGFFKLRLITNRAYFDQDRVHAGTILASLHYLQGKQYGDFSAETDKVAEYGLAALVAGVAAKKLGLLAVAGVALAKAWKLLVVAAAVFAAKFRKKLGIGVKKAENDDQGKPPQ